MSHVEMKYVTYHDGHVIEVDCRKYVPERVCHNVSEPPKDGGFWPSPHFKCSECGKGHVSMDYVDYCPNCGARVKED